MEKTKVNADFNNNITGWGWGTFTFIGGQKIIQNFEDGKFRVWWTSTKKPNGEFGSTMIEHTRDFDNAKDVANFMSELALALIEECEIGKKK